MRLFLDANVIFTAAHNPDGRSAALFDLARQHACALATSPHAAAEARRNIEVKYPDAVPRLQTLMSHAEMVPEALPAGVAWAAEQGLPPKDAPVLAAALACRADILVTGDRTHFDHLLGKRVRTLLVLTPADALARLLA